MTRDERLARLETYVNRLVESREHIAERMTELEVQMRFALNAMKMIVPNGATGILDANGRQPPPLIVNGWIAYSAHGGRELTMNQLQAEFLEQHVTLEALARQENGDTRSWQEICNAVREEIAAQARAVSATPDGTDHQNNGGSDPQQTAVVTSFAPRETRH